MSPERRFSFIDSDNSDLFVFTDWLKENCDDKSENSWLTAKKRKSYGQTFSKITNRRALLHYRGSGAGGRSEINYVEFIEHGLAKMTVEQLASIYFRTKSGQKKFVGITNILSVAYCYFREDESLHQPELFKDVALAIKDGQYDPDLTLWKLMRRPDLISEIPLIDKDKKGL